LKFENWGVPNSSIVVFEDMENITARAVAKLSEVSGRSFPDLGAAKERLPDYLREIYALAQN
jgi:hypothetical protein